MLALWKGYLLQTFLKRKGKEIGYEYPCFSLPIGRLPCQARTERVEQIQEKTLLFSPTPEKFHRTEIHPPPPFKSYLAPFTTSRVTWNFAWVSMSRTEGMGANVGWEWYQPTTANPRSAKSSEACVWDTGSISHCSPVLKLRQGIALETYTSKTMNKRLRPFLQQTRSISFQVCKEHNWQLAFNTLESCE